MWGHRVVLHEAPQEAGDVIMGLESHVRIEEIGLDGAQVEVVGRRVKVDQILVLVAVVSEEGRQLKGHD